MSTLRRFYREVLAAYPAAERIDIAQDNWPVHFHQAILSELSGTRIRLLRLPTYAPWTNPIEKVWRKLNQEVLHQHRLNEAPRPEAEVSGRPPRGGRSRPVAPFGGG